MNDDTTPSTDPAAPQSQRMQQLWAPWRLAYVTGDPEERQAGCFLCRCREDVDPESDRRNYVVERGSETIVVLNRYPYNNGHLLISPLAHKADLEELTESETAELMQQVRRYSARLRRLLRCDGLNIGLNLGEAAGAGLPGHLHWHIVPRWAGDTNFMPVLANVKVIPQSLEALHEYLTESRDDASNGGEG